MSLVRLDQYNGLSIIPTTETSVRLSSFTTTNSDGTQTHFVPESNDRHLLIDQVGILKARNALLTALAKDCLEFLEQPEHEIVNVYSEDHWKESIYCGLSLGWEEQRDALLARAKELIGS